MLETPTILIHAWAAASRADGATQMRSITSAAGAPLGFVRLDEEPGSSWFSWLSKIRLDVFETDDASHLMSVGRSWGVLRAWEVSDAEDRHVGTVHPRTILTGDRQRLGFLDFAADDHGRVLDPEGALLATHARQGSAVQLTFEPRPDAANPFLRMMILASVLVLQPTP